MLILEKPFCEEEFLYVKTLEDIKNSKPNTTLIFNYCDSSLELFNFCKLNDIEYGVIANSVKELIFCANLNAKYIFCENLKKAKEFQKIADNYLLDSKIVFLADSLDEIEEISKYTIDAIKLKGNK